MKRRLGLLVGIPLCVAYSSVAAGEKPQDTIRAVSPFVDVTLSLRQPGFASLSLDSLGRGKFRPGSLRQPVAPSVAFDVRRIDGEGLHVEYRRRGTVLATAPGWSIQTGQREVRLTSQWSEAEKPEPVILEFDPRRCHATLLGIINPDSSVRLPALFHLPDQGSFRITSYGAKKSVLSYDARRAGEGYVRIGFPPASSAEPRIEYRWEVVAVYPKVAGIEGDPRFDGFRRNWLNIFQINPRLRVLANHAASDTCAFCLYEYADIARHTPPLAEGLTALDLVRQSLDRYLEGLAGYGLPGNVGFDLGGKPSEDPPYLDSYPSLLIAATDYLEGSGDVAWLKTSYGGLRAWAEKLLAMDRDGNGLLEYPYSGNSHSWSGKGEKRPSNWWDCIGFGHEDAYANALAFRALRGIATLADRINKADDAGRYSAAAERLRQSFFGAFYNPETGVLAGWKSADGKLHDYYFLFVTGIAIHYGLVPQDKAQAIMDRLLAKLQEAGYRRFDLGLPGNLVAVPRKDYVHLDRRWGGGQREDNGDGFQIYENGGATACFAYFTLAALYDLGRRDAADRMLMPMLKAFEDGGFQGQRADGMSYDWKAWDGTPWGYEGFLVDNYYTLLAVLVRERALAKAGTSR